MSAQETIAKLREEVASLKNELASAKENGQGGGPRAPVLLKLSGKVNDVEKQRKTNITKGETLKHKAIIHLTDETKVTLEREVDPFDKLGLGEAVEIIITSPQMKLA